MTAREELQARLEQIDQELEDIQQRLPAHSVKPPIMMALFALEEEREQVLEQLTALSPGSGQ